MKTGLYRLKFALFCASLFPLVNLCAQTPCEDRSAQGYPCVGVDLMSIVGPEELLAEDQQGAYLSDIWGWTDPTTGKEYAIVCLINGTSFVDVSDPVNPIVLGILPEHHEASGRKEERGSGSIWRDAKVYQNYALIVSEDGGHGMQVFDLTQLRNVPDAPVTFSETAHYDGISNAHNIVAHEGSNYVYAVGSSGNKGCNGGGMHIIDMSDPLNPVYGGCYDSRGYTHDAQCVIYNGPHQAYRNKEICFNANEDEIVIADISNKSNLQTINSFSYAGAVYVHQGWLTEDHRYFISNDELDELNTGGSTKTFVWDVQNLNSPQLILTLTSKLSAIDHNLYVKNNYIYQSNYSAGLRILDARDIENSFIKEVGYFDTYTIDNGTNFRGSWSNYPFFESGNVIVSDRQSGLFVVKPTIVEEVVASVEEESFQDAYTIYPNPARNEININYLDLNGSPTRVDLYDVQGKLVKEVELPAVNYSGKKVIDISDIDKGIYQLRIVNEDHSVTKTVIKR